MQCEVPRPGARRAPHAAHAPCAASAQLSSVRAAASPEHASAAVPRSPRPSGRGVVNSICRPTHRATPQHMAASDVDGGEPRFHDAYSRQLTLAAVIISCAPSSASAPRELAAPVGAGSTSASACRASAKSVWRHGGGGGGCCIAAATTGSDMSISESARSPRMRIRSSNAPTPGCSSSSSRPQHEACTGARNALSVGAHGTSAQWSATEPRAHALSVSDRCS